MTAARSGLWPHTCRPCHPAPQVEEDPTGGKLASSTGRLNGAPHKLGAINNFHVGDTITAMQRAALQPGGQEVRSLVLCGMLTRASMQGLSHPPRPNSRCA